jgi:hypothetical protein
MSGPITFNIKYEDDRIKTIELDKQSKDKLTKKDQTRFEDLGTSLINGVSEGVVEGSRQIFKHVEVPRIVQFANAITFFIDKAMYLENERKKYE